MFSAGNIQIGFPAVWFETDSSCATSNLMVFCLFFNKVRLRLNGYKLNSNTHFHVSYLSFDRQTYHKNVRFNDDLV